MSISASLYHHRPTREQSTGNDACWTACDTRLRTSDSYGLGVHREASLELPLFVDTGAYSVHLDDREENRELASRVKNEADAEIILRAVDI